MTARARRDDEAGFTLIEVTITTLILAIVMTAILGLLNSQQKASNDVIAFVGSQEDVRLAVVTIARDLRGGDLVPSKAITPTQVNVMVYDPVTNAATEVQWRLNTATSKLVRETLDAAGTTVTATTYSVGPITNTTVFTYWTKNNNPPDTNGFPAALQPGCVSRIHVELTAATSKGTLAHFTEASDVAVRNSTASATLCP